MKKILLVLIMVLTMSQVAWTQSENKAFFRAYYSKCLFEDVHSNIFGLNLEVFLSKNFSLNYSFGLGNANGGLNFHCPAGVVGGIYMLVNETENEDLNFDEDEEGSSGFIYGSSVFLMLLPEGINYYFPLSQYITLGIYVNPFGYDYFPNGETLSSAIGIKAVYTINERLILIPQVGYNIFWTDWGVPSIGLSIGFKY